MRYRVFVALFLFIPGSLYAQLNPYDYELPNSSIGEVYEFFKGEELFYVPLDVDDADVFTKMSSYNFSAVRMQTRGYDNRMSRNSISNMDLSSLLSEYPDYNLLSNLRSLRLERKQSTGLISSSFGIGSSETFSASSSTIPDAKRVGLQFSNRRARYGINFSGVEFGKNWSLGLAGKLRTGKDSDIDGMFTSEANIALAGEYSFLPEHSLSIIIAGGISQRGGRSYTTQRAFDLAGDNLYNPSWGSYRGDVRNSKVYDESHPFVMLSYSGQATDATKIVASISSKSGKDSYSSLGWYNAEVPFPDYYKFLEDPYIYEFWGYGNEDFTQVNWTQLYQTNYNKDQAVYWIEKRVREVNDLQFAISGQIVTDKKTSIDYGVRSRNEQHTFYKEMKDLLGSKYIIDLDPFVSINNNDIHNDVRNPNRQVKKGGKFGYNYVMKANSTEAFTSLNYIERRYRLSVDASFGKISYQRDGKFEKQIYPANQSFGKSKKASFNTYHAKGAFDYYLSARHCLSVGAVSATLAPEYNTIFISPQYTNKLVESPKVNKFFSFETSYRLSLDRANLKASFYYSNMNDSRDILYYYDDIKTCYSNMIVTGVDKKFSGFEIAGSYDISNKLTISAMASIMRNVYTSDAGINIMDDEKKEVYVFSSNSYIKDFHIGGSPETLGSVELKYNTRGWIVSVNYNYMGGRYVEPMPLRRMERVYTRIETPSAFTGFVKQEKLDDASTVNLFILKSFNLHGNWLTATLSVNNLLGDEDIVYNGYEQNRVRIKESGISKTVQAFDSKYLYSYPRSFYFGLSYRF